MKSQKLEYLFCPVCNKITLKCAIRNIYITICVLLKVPTNINNDKLTAYSKRSFLSPNQAVLGLSGPLRRQGMDLSECEQVQGLNGPYGPFRPWSWLW